MTKETSPELEFYRNERNRLLSALEEILFYDFENGGKIVWGCQGCPRFASDRILIEHGKNVLCILVFTLGT